MKSFKLFQRFHDSQTGTSKSKTKDAAYKQRIPAPKPEKVRAPSPNGAEPSSNPASKRHETKTAGLPSTSVSNPEPVSRVPTDNLTTRFSTFPGLSTSRRAPVSILQAQAVSEDPSASTAPNLGPPDNAKEKYKPAPNHNEAVGISGDERVVVTRVKPERPSRSGQTNEPSVPQQQPQLSHPAESRTGWTEKGKGREREKQVVESDGGGIRAPRGNDRLDRRDARVRQYTSDREPDNGTRETTDRKERNRSNRDYRDLPRAGVVKEVQRWEQQEKDMRQLRERETRERERVKERKEKHKDKSRVREQENGEERGKENGEEKEKEKVSERETDKEGKREKDKEKDKERERGREKESWDERRQRAQKEKEAQDRQLRVEKEKREAREQQEKERQAKEQRERDRKERKAREQAEKAERERKEREEQERARKEKERQDREQRERERKQEEEWERKQEELERKERDRLERLEKERRREERGPREQDSQQRGLDSKELDLLQIGRGRQEQRERERENWLQEQEREREDRVRRRRGDRHPEPPEVVTDPGINDKASIRSQRKRRRDGVSDSEREQNDLREPDRRRLSRMTTQNNTPPKSDDRRFPIIETGRPLELLRSRSSKQQIQINVPDNPTTQREEPRQPFREDGYVSEQNVANYVPRNPSLRGIPPPEPSRTTTSSFQAVRSALPANVLQPLNPPGQPLVSTSVPSVERVASNTPATQTHYRTSDRPPASTPPGDPNQISSKSQVPPGSSVRPLDQKSRSTSGNTFHTLAHPSSTPMESKFQNALIDDSTTVPSISIRGNEQPQDIRIYPAPSIIQNSNSNNSSVARISVNHSIQEISSARDTRPPGQTNFLRTIHEDRPISPAIAPGPYPPPPANLTLSTPSTRPLDHLKDHSRSVDRMDGHQTPAPPSETIPPTSTPHPNFMSFGQPGHLANLNPTPTTVSLLQTSPITRPPTQEHTTLHNHIVKGSPGRDGGFQEVEQILVTSLPQPSAPSALSVPVSSRLTHAHKRVNSAPGQYETRQEVALPLGNKATSTPRPSPGHGFAKIYDETTPPREPVVLQSSGQDGEQRASHSNDKVPLQESPLPSRAYLSDKSNQQVNHVQRSHTPFQPEDIASQPKISVVSRDIRDHGSRDYDSARQGPPTDSYEPSLHRHQRHHSEPEVGRRINNLSRSQPTENHQVANPKPMGFNDSKLKPPYDTIRPEELKTEAQDAKVAFRTPTVDGGMTDNRKRVADSRPNINTPEQDYKRQSFQQVQKQDANSVSNLVSHYERMEDTARIGGNISRPGTAIPRPSASRPTTLEAPHVQNRVVPPIGPSQPVSIDRANTAIGLRPSVSSANQPQSRQVPPVPTKHRTSDFELISFPDMKKAPSVAARPVLVESRHDPSVPSIGMKTARAAPETHAPPNGEKNSPYVPTQPVSIETYYDHTPPNPGIPNASSKSLRSIPEAQIIPISLAAADPPVTIHRMPADPSSLPQKASYTEKLLVTEASFRGPVRSTAAEDRGVVSTALLPEHPTAVDRAYQQNLPPAREEKGQFRQNSSGRGEHGVAQSQTMHLVHAQSYSDPAVRKDNTGNSTRESTVVRPPSQTRQRKESSPRVYPRDDPPKVSKEGDIEDRRLQSYRPSHPNGDNLGNAPPFDVRHISQRTEPTRTEAISMAGPPIHRYATESSVPSSQPTGYSYHLPADDRGRNKHALGNYSPNALQRTNPIDPASISPQRTGNSIHSRTDEEGTQRVQRHPPHVKDVRLADLLSPPKSNDVPRQPYRQDARRTLTSRLEYQPGGSPSSNYGNSGSETSGRLRSLSGRGEHSPRYPAGGDSSPSGPSSSPSHNLHPDLPSRDYAYVRSSPNASNTSHHTPSPRSRAVVTETHPGPQPATLLRDEGLRHGPGTQLPRHHPTHDKRQDYNDAPDAEGTQLRRHRAYDTDTRTDATKRTSNIPPHSIPHQSLDSNPGRTISHKDGSRRDAHDVPQTTGISTRTRSNSQNMQEVPVSHSRQPLITYNTVQTQYPTPTHTPGVNYVPSSAMTMPSLGQSADQVQHFRSFPNQQQPPITREEALIPPPSTQQTSIRSTPSKKNYIAQLPSETHSANTSSATQPPTPKTYEIWLPPPSSHTDHGPPRPTPAPSHRNGREKDPAKRVSKVPRGRPPSPGEYPYPQLQTSDPRRFTPYHYMKTRKIRTMSLASMEAQDGAASTVIGSPTASILSTVPINIPPEQDPIAAAREWTEAAATGPGQRIRRPGLVWELPEDPPPIFQQEPRRPEPRSGRPRRPRSSGSRSREASDTDQTSS